MATLRLVTARQLGFSQSVRLLGCRFASESSAAPPTPPKAAPAAPKAAPAAPKAASAAPANTVPDVKSEFYPNVPKTGDPSQYNTGEYYKYNEYSYYDLDLDMMSLRIDAPSNTEMYSTFKAPVAQAKS